MCRNVDFEWSGWRLKEFSIGTGGEVHGSIDLKASVGFARPQNQKPAKCVGQ
jgi:hypothetical protein